MALSIKSFCHVLASFGCGVILLGCSTQTATAPSSPSDPSVSTAPSLPSNSEACRYVHNQQYPFDWEGSNDGACVQNLPPQYVSTIELDPISGLEVPRTTYKDHLVSISSPVGEGVGEWNGNYINGTINTSQGDAEFVCAGRQATGLYTGVCGLR